MRENLLLSLMLAACAGAVSAQTSTAFKEQFKLIKAPNAIASVGADLFGDKVNLYSGALEFIQNDVSLTGNNKLQVMIGRRLTAGQFAFDDRAFGKWNLEIPHLHGVFASDGFTNRPGWVGRDGSNSRCTKFGAPTEATGLQGSSEWHSSEFWRGNYLYVPGHGDQQMLRRAPGYARKPSSVRLDDTTEVKDFPIVTSAHWAVGCLTRLKNSSLGEGFLVIAPDGTKYVFDWLVNYKATTLTKSTNWPAPALLSESDSPEAITVEAPDIADAGLELPVDDLPEIVSGPTLPRTEVWILPSKIIDRFGNTVTYTYDTSRPANLTRIASSDGRVIDLTYVTDAVSKPTNLIKTIKDGTRTWTYHYQMEPFRILSSVALPDGTAWQLAQADSLMADLQYGSEPSKCADRIAPNDVTLQATLSHPTGATGVFTLRPVEHGRSRVREMCLENVLRTPIFYYTNSLIGKTISGPGLLPMTWNYHWEPANGSFDTCSACAGYEVMTITDPEGNVTRQVFGNQYFIDEGKLLLTDLGWNGSSALRSTWISYRAPSASNPYPVQVGHVDEFLGSGSSDVRLMPEEVRTIVQQGVQFSWIAESFDNLARPVQVRRASGLGTSRTEVTTYFDNDARWVLGQIGEVTSADKSMTKVEYDPTSLLPRSKSSFGIVQQSMTYGTDGTLKTLKEGRKTTRFSSYKRGVPQLVEYLWPTGAVYATEKSEINNLGNPDSTTDTEGNKTGYLYDAMGRLSKINYPSTTTVPEWASTTIKFSRAAAAKYGLPIGHWRYEVKTGNGYVINYYDALWRPVVSEQFDSANADATLRITKRMFDSGGRTIYESYPKRTYDALGDGTHYQFDALGRTEMIGKNSELETGMLYSGFTYKDDFVTEQVDYRGKPTLISYLTFDQPSQEMIVKVAAPLGVITEIKRDNFGKPLSVRRSDAKKSATRTYIYDAHERLCKTIEPETGGTVQAYDAYNTIAWKASGQSKDATCQTAILDAAKTTFGYDHMNRLLTTTFGDKSPAISRTYTRDGLFDTVSSGGSLWSFAYNNRRMLKSETVSYSNVRYPIGRNYDANGNLKSITYPSNTTPPLRGRLRA